MTSGTNMYHIEETSVQPEGSEVDYRSADKIIEDCQESISRVIGFSWKSEDKVKIQRILGNVTADLEKLKGL